MRLLSLSVVSFRPKRQTGRAGGGGGGLCMKCADGAFDLGLSYARKAGSRAFVDKQSRQKRRAFDKVSGFLGSLSRIFSCRFTVACNREIYHSA